MSRKLPRLAAVAAAVLLVAALMPLVSAATAETVADDFDTASFAGSTGSLPWATTWLELGELDGPGAGLIQVAADVDCTSGPCLVLGSTTGTASVEREADLRGASAATLTFDRRRRLAGGGGGQVELAISADGGTGWAILQTWDLDASDASAVPESFDITAYATRETRVRFAVLASADASQLDVDDLGIAATIEDAPPAAWYLKSDGYPGASLGAVPVATSLGNYDALRNAEPGLTLQPTSNGLAESSPDKYQVWLAPAQWHEIDGTVDLVMWSALKGFTTGARGVLEGGLYDCNSIGTDCNLLASGLVDLPDWSGGSPTWVERTLPFGNVTASIATDRSLRIKVVVGNNSANDMMLAYDTVDYPSRLDLPVAVNQPPALDPIGPQAGAEGTALTFTASASDPDTGDALTFSLVDGTDAVPAGATIDPNSGDFAWTPTEAEGPGTYRFKVRVADDGTPGLADEEEVLFTISEVNAPPVLDPIGPQAGDEHTAITFTATATDPDLPANGLVFALGGTVPGGAAIDPASGAFTWTPNEAQGPGTYVFDVVVTDDGSPPRQDLETIAVTVAEANAAPAADPIGTQSVDEEQTLSLTATATDTDLPADTLTWSLVSGPGAVTPAGAYSWTPAEADGPGSYTVTLRVTDDGAPARSDDVAFDVNVAEVNLAPTLVDPGPQTDGELDTVSLFVAAGDPDLPADTLTWSALSLPLGLTMNPFTGEIAGTVAPGAALGSPYAVQVSVTDDGVPPLGDLVTFSWAITDTNQSPTLDPIGPQGGAEGVAITFTATASDPDLPPDTLTFSLAGAVPGGAAIDPASGAFSWTPNETQGPGAYTFDVVVTDSGGPTLSDSETITVTVTEVNTPPSLDPIGPQSGDEGTAITFTATATDSDLPVNGLTFSLSGTVPAGAAIDPATGAFTWTPGESDGGGTFIFDVVVSDDGTPTNTDFETIAITVADVNTAPTLDPIGPQAGAEGVPLTFTAAATDPDLPADTLTFSLAGAVPAGAGIDPASGAFTWTPTEAQGPGVYSFDVVVDDGGTPPLAAAETITVTVSEVNAAPSLAPIADPSGGEGTAITFIAAATDPDLPPNAITYGLSGAPAGAAIDPASGAFTWTPGEADGPGSYTFDVVATDDGAPPQAASHTITVTVAEVNTPPVATDPGAQLNGEGDPVSLFVAATDADLPANTLTWSAAGLPPGLGVDPGTGEIAGTVGPLAASGSPYGVTVTVSDDAGPPGTDFVAFTWTVVDTNRSPTLDPIGAQAGSELAAIGFTATAADPDLDGVTFSLAGAVPAGAGIDPAGGVFAWTPTEAQGPGVYTFDVVATDDGTPPLAATETITVTVAEVNAPPALAAIGAQSAAEGVPLTFTASASDPDAPANGVTFSLAGGAPAGAAIDPASGAFTWTPGEVDGGAVLTFDVVATDDGTPPLADAVSVTVTVAETNQPPVVAPIAAPAGDEGTPITFVAVATDPDLPANVLTYSLLGAPPGAAIDPATGAFTWVPDETAGPGVFAFDVVATDDGAPPLAGVRPVSVTVTEANQAPVLAPIGPHGGDEGAEIAFTATATDADLPANGLTYSLAGAVPTGAAIDPVTGAFAWTPSEGQGPGAFAFDVVVSDDGSPAQQDAETVMITVAETPTAPVLDPVGSHDGIEGQSIAFTATATDADLPADPLVFSLDGPVPPGAAITADGQFTWAPTERQGPGAYTFTVVVSDGELSDSETISIGVGEANAPPRVDRIDPIAADEGTTVTFTATARDHDVPANALSFSLTTAAPAGAAIDPITGEFTWPTGEADGPGEYRFGIVATDDGAPSAAHVRTVTVTLAEVNSPPVLAPLPDVTGEEGGAVVFTATATDPDLPVQELTYSLDGNAPAGATIDPATGEFAWTPAGPAGTYQFDVVIADSGEPVLTDRAKVTVTVTASPKGSGGTPPPPPPPQPPPPPPPPPPPAPPELAPAAPPIEAGPPPVAAEHAPLPFRPYADPAAAPAALRPAGGEPPDTSDREQAAATARKQRLIEAIAGIGDPAGGADQAATGLSRTLVLMARAALDTAAALGTPLGMLLGAIGLVATLGRISLIPVFRRRRQQTGTVQWFDTQAGFGLILPDGSDEQVFAHISTVSRRDRQRVFPGRRVTYGIMPGPRRSIATRVRPTG